MGARSNVVGAIPKTNGLTRKDSMSSTKSKVVKMNKPVVHYTPTIGDKIELNQSGIIRGVVDHPYISPLSPWVVTSKIIRLGENGEFETLNTIYRPIYAK